MQSNQSYYRKARAQNVILNKVYNYKIIPSIYYLYVVSKMRKTQKQIVENPVIQRILETLKSRSVKQNELTDHLGLSNGIFTKWKYDGGESYMKYIDSIADFLHVSKEYLLYGGNEDCIKFEIMPSEIELIKKYRKLSDNQRSYISDGIDLFINSNSR